MACVRSGWVALSPLWRANDPTHGSLERHVAHPRRPGHLSCPSPARRCRPTRLSRSTPLWVRSRASRARRGPYSEGHRTPQRCPRRAESAPTTDSRLSLWKSAAPGTERRALESPIRRHRNHRAALSGQPCHGRRGRRAARLERRGRPLLRERPCRDRRPAREDDRARQGGGRSCRFERSSWTLSGRTRSTRTTSSTTASIRWSEGNSAKANPSLEPWKPHERFPIVHREMS